MLTKLGLEEQKSATGVCRVGSVSFQIDCWLSETLKGSILRVEVRKHMRMLLIALLSVEIRLFQWIIKNIPQTHARDCGVAR